jgi:Protein of unknown function (DUF4230)
MAAGRRMDIGWVTLLFGLMLLAVGGFAFYTGGKKFSRWFAPGVVASAQSALTGVQNRNELVVFAAHVVVTSTGATEEGALLPAKMTLIVPGRVLYGVNLSGLTDNDFRFDRANGRLMVRVPDVSIISVEPDIGAKEEFPEIGLRKLIGAEPELRKQAEIKIAEQMRREAESEDLKKLARQSAVQQLEGLFEPALRAAGHNRVEVQIQVGPDQQM